MIALVVSTSTSGEHVLLSHELLTFPENESLEHKKQNIK